MNEFEEWKKLHDFYSYSDYLTEDLANFLNVSTRTIQRWIRGTSKPSKEKLVKIRIYLSQKIRSELNSNSMKASSR